MASNEIQDDSEQIAGDELDDSEQLSGDELDDVTSENELDEAPDEESEPIQEEETAPDAKKKSWMKNRLILPIAVIMSLLVGIPGLYFILGSDPKEKPLRFHKIVLPVDQPFLLDLFIIPFQRGKEFAFASLSITFNYRGDELKKELGRQKYRLRWIICDVFQDEVSRKGKVPSPEKLKELILIAAGKTLSAGRIKGVDINEFTVL